MELKSKCSQCTFNQNCALKTSLNEAAQKIIKKAEELVRQDLPPELECLICTDVAIIPTNCRRFVAKDNLIKNLLQTPAVLAPNPSALAGI